MSTEQTAEDRRFLHNFAMQWFEIHAAQRLKMISFFIVIVAACITGYFTALELHNKTASSAAASAMAFISLCFAQIDRRTCQLVRYGETYLADSLTYYEKEVKATNLNFIEMANDTKGVWSYSQTFKLMFSVTLIVGIVAAISPWVIV